MSLACRRPQFTVALDVPGEVVAERVRARFAAQHGGEHYGDPGVTGSIKQRSHRLGYSGEDDDRLPMAVPGDD